LDVFFEKMKLDFFRSSDAKGLPNSLD